MDVPESHLDQVTVVARPRSGMGEVWKAKRKMLARPAAEIPMLTEAP